MLRVAQPPRQAFIGELVFHPLPTNFTILHALHNLSKGKKIRKMVTLGLRFSRV